MIEILGFIAGIFVLISFLCKSEKRIRKVSIISETLYTVYGLLICSPSILVLNIILIVIQIVMLARCKDNG